MSRTLAGISLSLMLVTGLVVGQLATVNSAWQSPAAASSAATIQAAYDFYDAINDFMSSGNPVRLRSTLSPDFVDHSLHRSDPATGADLERYIESVRLESPGLRFSVTPVLREPGVVAVAIASNLSADEENLRSQVDVRGSLPSFDLLKLQGSKVIERWSFPVAPPSGRVEAIATVSLRPSPPATGFVLERFALDPFAQLDFLHEAGIVILTESGAVTCESVATSSLGQLQETQETCRTLPDRKIIVEFGRSIRLRNPGPEPATLVTLRLQSGETAPIASPPESIHNAQPGIASQTLAFGLFHEEQRGPLEVVIQEVFLAPGNGVADHTVPGTEVGLMLSGAINVSSLGGSVESGFSGGNLTTIGAPIETTAGNAFFAHHGSRLAYQNTSDEDATVLVFGIASADIEAT